MPRRPSVVTAAQLAKAIALVKAAHGAAEVVFGADGSVRVTPAIAPVVQRYEGKVRL